MDVVHTDANIVYISIGLGISQSPSNDNVLKCSRVGSNLGDHFDSLKERLAGKQDGFLNDMWIDDFVANHLRHNDLFGKFDKFVVEYVEIYGIANCLQVLARTEHYINLSSGNLPPPMTRMLRVNADTVAIRSSGQTIVVMMEAGTRIPPIPRPARIKIGYITISVRSLRVGTKTTYHAYCMASIVK
jgi:hypothetical protein